MDPKEYNNLIEAFKNHNTNSTKTKLEDKKSVPSVTSWTSKLASVFYKKPTQITTSYNNQKKTEQFERQKREIAEAKKIRSPALLGRNIAIEEGKIKEAKKLSNYLVNKAVEKKNVNFNELRKNRILKENENIKYILNKLEPTNYDLLYKLINTLFDPNLSKNSREQTKEKFQEYLIKNPDKKEHIFKILKSIYRLKYNKSIDNSRKERIIKNSKSIDDIKEFIKTNNTYKIKPTNTNENKKKKEELQKKLQINLENYKKAHLENIEDLSSSMNLAFSFHIFSKKTYYICNGNQLKTNFETNDIRSLNIEKINDLSPLYYENGICCFNPKLKTYLNNAKGLKEGFIKESSKNKSQEYGVEMVDIEKNNKKNYIDMVPIIDNIEKYNNKNSILSKFFDKYILGMANEYGINENNRKNKNSEINSKNFDRFSDEFGGYIDTIIVVENGKITFTYTKTKKSDGEKIFTNYLKIQSGGSNIQVGGLDVFSILALISIIIGFFISLCICYNSNDKENTTIVKIVGYLYCVTIATFSVALGFLGAFYYLSLGPIMENGKGVICIIVLPTLILLPFNPRLLRLMKVINNPEIPNPNVIMKNKNNSQIPKPNVIMNNNNINKKMILVKKYIKNNYLTTIKGSKYNNINKENLIQYIYNENNIHTIKQKNIMNYIIKKANEYKEKSSSTKKSTNTQQQQLLPSTVGNTANLKQQQLLPSTTENIQTKINNSSSKVGNTAKLKQQQSSVVNKQNTLNLFINKIGNHHNKLDNFNEKIKKKKRNDFKKFVRNSIKKNNEINQILKSDTIKKEKKIEKGMNGKEREIEEYVSSRPKEEQMKIREYIERKYTEKFTNYYQKLEKKNKV